jgi:hypothetical protein
MAKTGIGGGAEDLARMLKQLRAQYRAIRTDYEEPDPDLDLLDDQEYWEEVTVIDLTIKPAKREFRPSFAEAYSDACIRQSNV